MDEMITLNGMPLHMSNTQWKVKGLYKADPKLVYEEIRSIGDSFTPEEIVDKARDESTELHKCFEWDDSKAAEKYRLSQARQVVRMLVFTKDPTEEEPKPEPVRLIVNQNLHNRVYQPIQISVRNEDSYQLMLKTAMRELESFKKKYEILSELEAVLEAIEETLQTA